MSAHWPVNERKRLHTEVKGLQTATVLMKRVYAPIAEAYINPRDGIVPSRLPSQQWDRRVGVKKKSPVAQHMILFGTTVA
jgi:hypothetical protein